MKETKGSDTEVGGSDNAAEMINSLEGKLGHEKVKSEGSSKKMQKGEAEGGGVESNKIEQGKSYSYSYLFFLTNITIPISSLLHSFSNLNWFGFYYCDVCEEQKVLI